MFFMKELSIFDLFDDVKCFTMFKYMTQNLMLHCFLFFGLFQINLTFQTATENNDEFSS